jgi:hypothetical protein
VLEDPSPAHHHSGVLPKNHRVFQLDVASDLYDSRCKPNEGQLGFNEHCSISTSNFKAVEWTACAAAGTEELMLMGMLGPGGAFAFAPCDHLLSLFLLFVCFNKHASI